MDAKINVRLDEPSNLEVIRDQISGIIALEMAHQYDMAVEAEDPAYSDYKVSVFVENDEPWNVNGGQNIFPLVNVFIDDVDSDSNSSINTCIRDANINIDCYQTGNYAGTYAGRNGSIKAWKLARCISKILDSDEYTYLDLRNIVRQKKIFKMKAGRPDIDSAIKVVLVRISLRVNYSESAPQNSGPILEKLPVTISDENGQVVIDITEDITEEE